MILDSVPAGEKYYSLHPGFRAAFAFIGALAERQALSVGRVPLDGERLFAIIEEPVGRGRDGAKLEVHRRYIDIQVCLAGQETIGWRPLADCVKPEAEFNTERDIRFFVDSPANWFDLAPGTFAIFYPDDAHAPLAGAGPLRKVVVKVAVDWPAALSASP